MAKDVKYYLKRHKSLQENRMPFDNLWMNLADYIQPQRSYPFKTDTVQKVNFETSRANWTRTFESTAQLSVDIFASSLVGFLANPAMQWFALEPTDKELMKNRDVALWFDVAAERMLAAFNEPAAKFYSNLKMCAIDLGVFGTVGMWVQEGTNSMLEFSARYVKELYVSEDASGNVDTVYRELLMTPRQMAQKFGVEALSPRTREKLQEKPDDLTAVIHALEPREDYDPDRQGRLDMPISSVYIEKEAEHILEESGFHEMPLPVSRWDVYPNDVYGTSPAVRVLPDIKMVNQIEKTYILAAEKTLNPPMQIPFDGFLGNLDLSAGAINVRRDAFQGGVEPIITIGNIPFTVEMLASKKNLIREAFYVDQLQLMESPQMTATEVMARTDEKLRLMAPMIGRVQSELLGPIIERVFGILYRRSLAMGFENAPFPEPPEILQQTRFKVKYISPLERAQRASEANSIVSFVNSIVPLSQVDPSVLDNLDFDEIVRELHDIQSVPSLILKDPREVNRERQAREQQQQQMMALEQMKQGSEVARNANQAGLI
jgi:hypothetical protein